MKISINNGPGVWNNYPSDTKDGLVGHVGSQRESREGKKERKLENEIELKVELGGVNGQVGLGKSR